jgi:hypothetical protein
MATTDTKAEPGGPVPPIKAPPPPLAPRRRWLSRLLIILLMVLLVPVAVLACLALQNTTLSLHAGLSPHAGASSADELACPATSPPFTDCYTRARITVTPIEVDKSQALQLCCDFLVERQATPTVSVSLPETKGARWSDADRGSALVWTLLDTASGAETTTSYRQGGTLVPLSMDIAMSGPAGGSPPMLGGILPEAVSTRILDFISSVAANLPPSIGGPWTADITPARLAITVSPTSTPRHVVGRAGDQDVTRLSITFDIEQSLLFGEHLAAAGDPGGLGAVLASAPVPSAEHLRARVLDLAMSLDAKPDARAHLTHAATLIDQLDGADVSRLSRISEEAERATEAGEQCIALYQSLRATLSRLDAALTTYAVALPSGLLTQRPGQFDHGCIGASAEADNAELNQDWRVLSLEIPETGTALEDTGVTAAGPGENNAESNPDDNQSRPARDPSRFLLSIASATKSGAGLDQLEAALAGTLSVRIGETARYDGRDRGDVIRMLHRQWSHAGCWRYDTGDGAGTLTVHVEAQFPFLNHIAFRRDDEGLITAIEITGVTLQELYRVKRRNTGGGCQAFLDPGRLSDYALWLSAEGGGARTPVDHALRLLEDGPGAIGTLKLR